MILRDCIVSYKFDELKHILATGQEDVNFVDQYGITALWYAASRGFTDCITALIDAKADVNKADYYGRTPLHQTSLHGNSECVRLLVQHKANVKAHEQNGFTALHFACRGRCLICAQILVAAIGPRELDVYSSNGLSPLAYAIADYSPKIAQLLLHSGAKMKHVSSKIEIPSWMHQLIEKRETAMHSALTLKGVLKRKLGQSKDVTHLIALYVWSMRLCF